MQRVRHGLSHGLMPVVGGRGVPAGQAPAVRPANIDVGDVERAVRAGVITHEEDFGQVMDRDDRAVPVGDGFGLNAQTGVDEDAAPAFADGDEAEQAHAGRMNAHRVIIFCPYEHHAVGITLDDRLVKGAFNIVGQRENSWPTAQGAILCWQAAKTSSGCNLFRQSRWPSGHSRLKQGLQPRLRLRMSARSESGGVKPGDDEP